MSLKIDKNLRLLIILVVAAFGMLGVAYGFVPLYRLFCATFGIPVPSVLVGEAGAPKEAIQAAIDTGTASDRVVTVRFMANTAVGVPVEFGPQDRRLRVRLGEPALTAYDANNYSPRDLTGLAVHTIIAVGGPDGVNIDRHIELQQCFCFEEQFYPAETDITLPLSFTISPELPDGIHTITFAYTLFESGV